MCETRIEVLYTVEAIECRRNDEAACKKYKTQEEITQSTRLTLHIKTPLLFLPTSTYQVHDQVSRQRVMAFE